MGGYALPPFFILPCISETRDINELLDISGIFLASNESGWMTEAMFTLWCLVFSCQLTQYKLANNIDPNEQDYKGLFNRSTKWNQKFIKFVLFLFMFTIKNPVFVIIFKNNYKYENVEDIITIYTLKES